MTGCWVTWPAEIRTRPDIGDPRPHLEQAVEALRRGRDIEDAGYQYEPRLGRVNFVLRVRWGITEPVAKRQAIDALHAMLPSAGFDTGRAGPPYPPLAWLRFDWWPSSFGWSP